MPCRRAQQWPQSSLSCFELFRAPRGRRALGDARAAARGPHRCKIERERRPRETRALTRQPTQGSKAGGGGERADANSEFARKYNLDDKELGTGAFSRVILATSNEGTKVAVKCISKNGELKQEDVDSLHEEVAVLRSVDHPNIVKLYDFFDEKRYYYMVRRRRPAVLRRLHAIDATRFHQTRSWVFFFSSLRPFGTRRETAMLRAGAKKRTWKWRTTP